MTSFRSTRALTMKWNSKPRENQLFKNLSEADRQKQMECAKKTDYFHYHLHPSDVQSLFKQEGDFVLRLGATETDPDGFCITVRWKDDLQNIPILWDMEKRKCYIDEPEQFANLNNLVYNYTSKDKDKGMSTKGKGALAGLSGLSLLRAKQKQNWELLDSTLTRENKLGSGAFGSVFKGAWLRRDGILVQVAIKTLDNMTSAKNAEERGQLDRARAEMVKELRTTREFYGHPNVVKGYGYTIDLEVPCAVMEFMSGGSLLGRLSNVFEPISLKEKLKALVEASRGLGFVNRSGFVHRDVAARNILCMEIEVSKEVGQCKLSDFGLAREMDSTGKFQGAPGEPIPISWSSVESLNAHEWTAHSEVWAMGVLIWEVFTNGAKPYAENVNECDAKSVLGLLRKGFRLQPVDSMPAGIKELMETCFLATPQMRPNMGMMSMRLLEEYINCLNNPTESKSVKASVKVGASTTRRK